jgi:hypothetical protein
MTLTTPFLRTTLHFGQIFLTDALTFIIYSFIFDSALSESSFTARGSSHLRRARLTSFIRQLISTDR